MSLPQQSPINLQNPYQVPLGHRGLVVKYCGSSHAHVVKEAEGARIQFPARHFWNQVVEVDGKPFGLYSIHFHAPSEHSIEDRFHDLEWHLVHLNLDDGATYVVIALLIDFDQRAEAPGPDGARHQFLDRLSKVLGAADLARLETTDCEVEIEPMSLLPPHPEDQAYYRYEGSLTTPGYDENASWIVMPPVRVPREYFSRLGLLEHMEKPARLPQPLGRRMILQNRPAPSASPSNPPTTDPAGEPEQPVADAREPSSKVAKKKSRR